MIVVVEDLATYQAALDQGKTAPSVMYLILKERQVYFNSELWSKAPEEGGGTASYATQAEVADGEEAGAAALTQHEAQLRVLETEVRAMQKIVNSVASTVEGFSTVILDNEEVTAKALIDLHNRVKLL